MKPHETTMKPHETTMKPRHFIVNLQKPHETTFGIFATCGFM